MRGRAAQPTTAAARSRSEAPTKSVIPLPAAETSSGRAQIQNPAATSQRSGDRPEDARPPRARARLRRSRAFRDERHRRRHERHRVHLALHDERRPESQTEEKGAERKARRFPARERGRQQKRPREKTPGEHPHVVERAAVAPHVDPARAAEELVLPVENVPELQPQTPIHRPVVRPEDHDEHGDRPPGPPPEPDRPPASTSRVTATAPAGRTMPTSPLNPNAIARAAPDAAPRSASDPASRVARSQDRGAEERERQECVRRVRHPDEDVEKRKEQEDPREKAGELQARRPIQRPSRSAVARPATAVGRRSANTETPRSL